MYIDDLVLFFSGLEINLDMIMNIFRLFCKGSRVKFNWCKFYGIWVYY